MRVKQKKRYMLLMPVLSARAFSACSMKLLLTVLIACSLQGCQDNDGDSQPTGHESVAVKLALSVAKSTSPGTTRMTSGNVKGIYNDIAVRCVIPFDVDGKIAINDKHKQKPLAGEEFEQAVNGAIFYSSHCSFDPGVKSVLAYARKKTRTPGAAQGELVETFPADLEPNGIRFDLQSVTTGDALKANAKAGDLAVYMTDIANAFYQDGDEIHTWKDCAALSGQYNIFVNMDGYDGNYAVLPGSSANIRKWVETRRAALLAITGLSENDEKVKAAIVDKMGAIETLFGTSGTLADFPASLGLPDGAAVIRWDADKNEFVYETETTTMGNINGVDRFAFPAEIYYFGNSKIQVSNADETATLKNDENKVWTGESGILSSFKDGSVVQSATKAVAMTDPLQYGVALLQVKMKAESGNLLDNRNVSVSVTNGTKSSFPLTGVIVGGQLPVGFDFTPATVMSTYSESDMKFIYDGQAVDKDDIIIYLQSDAFSKETNTLVLQSYDGKNVKIALEFVNNSSVDFEGLTGIVYKGTKFYLLGEIIYTDGTLEEDVPDDVKNRVFTQDRITKVSVKVNNLKKAYNVLPDLMSPRLEMGLELTPRWVQTTPVDVELTNDKNR